MKGANFAVYRSACVFFTKYSKIQSNGIVTVDHWHWMAYFCAENLLSLQ